MRATMAARGLPPGIVDTMMGIYIAGRDGEFVAVDPTLERWIGRHPSACGR